MSGRGGTNALHKRNLTRGDATRAAWPLEMSLYAFDVINGAEVTSGVSFEQESTRSIGILQPEVCTVYEVEPSSATLCPTGSSRRKSVDPRFPHKNTLNPSGRTPSRDRSPGGGPGGVRRGSYIATVADTDPRAAAGQRKQSFVIISNE